MSHSSRLVFLSCIFFLFFACKKGQININEDRYIEQTEHLSALKPEISALGIQFIEVSWEAVSNTHFKQVTYSVYLDDQQITNGLTTTKYSFINLNPGQEYHIKVIASSNGNQTEQLVEATTLNPPSESQQTLYHEYKLHTFSNFIGAGSLAKCADGGHIVVRFLQHPSYFGIEPYKSVVFKLDKYGQMLWYRLLTSVKEYPEFSLNVSLHNQDKECIVLLKGDMFKIATNNGDIMMKKNFQNILNDQDFGALFYISSQEMITGASKGDLLSINPQDLSLNWQHINPDRTGSITAINVDSKKNIYYIAYDKTKGYNEIKVYKYNSKGEFLEAFTFDGTVASEGSTGITMVSLLVDPEDNLYLFGRNINYNSLRYFKFRPDGTLIKKNEQSENLVATQAFFNDKGEIVVAGLKIEGVFNIYSGIYVFDKNLDIKSKSFNTSIPYHRLVGITGNADGSYNIFLHYVTTYSYDNRNFVFIKTDSNGKI